VASSIGLNENLIILPGDNCLVERDPLFQRALRRHRQGVGIVNIATTRIYDRCKMKPEGSPTFKVSY